MKLLNEWEVEKGIKIKKIKRKTKSCKEKYFKKLILTNYIVIKTEKGLEYYEETKKEGDII